MKRFVIFVFGVLACALRASAEPVTFASEFSVPEGTTVLPGNTPRNRTVAIFQNNLALSSVASGPGAFQERLAGIKISPTAERLLPAASLTGMDAAQVANVVQQLVKANPALISEFVAIALAGLGADDPVARELIISKALAGLSGQQQDIRPVAEVLALLASGPDAEYNATVLIAAIKGLVKNEVTTPEFLILKELLLDIKIFELTEAPPRDENDGSFVSGDQGTGNVGSAPLGGGSGGGGGGSGGSNSGPQPTGSGTTGSGTAGTGSTGVQSVPLPTLPSPVS